MPTNVPRSTSESRGRARTARLLSQKAGPDAVMVGVLSLAKAREPLRWMLAVASAYAVQGDIQQWALAPPGPSPFRRCRRHRPALAV
jgi:hypothetical protein